MVEQDEVGRIPGDGFEGVAGGDRANELKYSQGLFVNLILEMVVLDDENAGVVHGLPQSNTEAPLKSSFRIARRGDENGEGASASGRRLDTEPVAHFLGDFIDHGQTQAGAASRGEAFRGEERFEMRGRISGPIPDPWS